MLATAGFCAGAALPQTSTARLVPAALGLVSLWAAVLVGYLLRFNLPGTPYLLALGLAGIVLGLAAGVLTRPFSAAGNRVREWPPARRPGARLRPGRFAGPLRREQSPDRALRAHRTPRSGPSDTPAGLCPDQRRNDLGPTGVRARRRGPGPGPTAVGARGGHRLLCGWLALLPRASGLDMLEVLFAPVGVWVGVWIGERTRISAPMPATERAPMPPPATGPPPPPTAASEAGSRPRLPRLALPRPHPLAPLPPLDSLPSQPGAGGDPPASRSPSGWPCCCTWPCSSASATAGWWRSRPCCRC